MIRVLVADDHPVVRRGVMQVLAEEPDMEIVGEADSAAEVLRQVRKSSWDVLLLDIAMPGRSGLDVLGELKKLRPKLPVLVLSMHPEDQFGIRVLRAGAAGYMTKETVSAELATAIRRIFSGKKYISANLAERLASDLENGQERPVHEMLSDREFQVMQMISSGKMIKEIAAELTLSIKTISTYRTRILRKLKIQTNAELTIFALDHQLITPVPSPMELKDDTRN